MLNWPRMFTLQTNLNRVRAAAIILKAALFNYSQAENHCLKTEV